jgi:hypothetical protein
MSTPSDHEEYLQHTLESHIKLGEKKPVSYLPIKTIVDVIGMTVSEYQTKVSAEGNKSIYVSPDDCCILSGIVYAYNERALIQVLERHHDLLVDQGWPLDSDLFLRRLASEWLDEQNPIMPVVKSAFGD